MPVHLLVVVEIQGTDVQATEKLRINLRFIVLEVARG